LHSSHTKRGRHRAREFTLGAVRELNRDHVDVCVSGSPTVRAGNKKAR